jgi:hypothetical protein
MGGAVHVRVAPSTVRVGQGVVVAAAVRPTGPLCGATLSHLTTSIKLRTKKAVAGAANWVVTIPANAPSGAWTARVACVKAGSGVARFSVLPKLSPPPTIPAKVVVVKSGVSSTSSFGETDVSYGIVLQNVSPDEDALDVALTVNILDASGLIIKTETDTYRAIPAGATYYAGGSDFLTTSTPARRIDVTAQVGSRQKKALGALPAVANVHVGADPFDGTAHVLGEWANPYTKPISELAQVTAVCFDSAGNVIGGGGDYLDAPVPAGGRVGFDVPTDAPSASQIAPNATRRG